MRMLELNQTSLWYVNRIGQVEIKDEDGNFTGELETSYSEPISISLHLYPANGAVLERTFGLTAEIDFVTGTPVQLDKGTLIFRERPIDNYSETYDFSIENILQSLNGYEYGLKGRR